MGIHIEKITADHLREPESIANRLRLNSTFPTSWQQGQTQTSMFVTCLTNNHICQRVSLIAMATLSEARRWHVCELGLTKLSNIGLGSVVQPGPGCLLFS